MLKILSFVKKSVKHVNSIDRINLSKNFYWIDLSNPSKQELDKLSSKLKIFPHDLKCSLDKREKPRISNNKDYSLIIFRAPLPGKDKITSTSPVGVFVSKRFVITVHKGEVKSIKELMKNHEPFKNLDSFVYDILSSITREYFIYLEKVEEQLDKIETKSLHAESHIKNIFDVKKTIIYFRKALYANREVTDFMAKEYIPILKDKVLFNMLQIEKSQLVDSEELIRERLTTILEIHLTSVSNKLNEVMKSFTVIASVLLLPMVISGIYGMNFRIIPLSQHLHGFWLIIGVMIFGMLLMLLFFRLKKWI
tara:strand:+ start:19805 stop:20728 length:924 start_codon:yes stop_codon:yes gene_type:complete